MSIKATNPNPNPTHQQQQQPNSNPNFTNAQPNPNMGSQGSYGHNGQRNFSNVNWSLTDTSGLFGGSVAIYSEAIALLEKAMKETPISTMGVVNYGFAPLTRAEYPQLGVDVMLMTVSFTLHKFKGITAIYAIGLTPNNEPVNTYQVQMPDGNRLIANEYPSQALGGSQIPKFLVDVARTRVPEGEYVVFAGSTVIRTDTTDVTSEEATRNMVINAINAGRMAINRRVNEVSGTINDLNLAFLTKNPQTNEHMPLHLNLSRRLTDEVSRDLTGSPIRSDLVFNLTSVPATVNGQQLVARTDFGMATAYIDVLPASMPGQTVSNTGIWQEVPQQVNGGGQNRMFTANVVFTGLFNRSPQISPSLSSQLFLLASSVAALDGGDDWWARFGLNPNAFPGQNNRHSIDGLGYEVSTRLQLPNFEPFANGTEPMSDDQYLRLIGQYVHPEYGISLEVNESTEGYYLHNMFARAASEQGEKLRTADCSNAMLLDAADNLTNGQFRPIYLGYKGSGKIVSELTNRVTVYGYYTDPKTGQVRSLQDFDRRMLLNMVDGRPEVMEVVRQWTYAQVDPALTYDQRKVIMCECIGRMLPNAVVTGYGRRLDFEPAFLKALVEGIQKLDACLHMNNVHTAPGSHHVASYLAGHTMTGTGRGFVQQTPYVANGNGPSQGMYGGYTGGW